MFKNFTLAVAAIGATMTLAPAAAQAQSYGYYDGGRYDRSYRNDYRGDRYYHDGRQYRGDRYSGRNYRGDRYQARRGCDGTAGTIIGAIAGGLLGDAVAGRRGDETAGLIIGGAAGALAGRAIDKSDCRRR